MLSTDSLQVSGLNERIRDVYFGISMFLFVSSLPYNSRTNRKRRAVVNSTDTSNEVNPERLSMYRAIEVFLPKDEDNLPMG